jgi:hypothetical protein
MAFKNSVKATLLETEEPCSPADEPRPTVDVPAPIAERPVEKPIAQRPVKEPAASRPVDTTAKPTRVAKSKSSEEAFVAATWHRRGAELCAMADTLPSQASSSLLAKIAGLYDELARDAGWTERETPVLEPLPLEEAAPAADEPPAAEDPPVLAPLADPLPQDRVTFARRPLRLGRRFPRRRA